MSRIIERHQSLPKNLKKMIGYAAFVALILQLFISGISGSNTANAQTSDASLTVTKIVNGGSLGVGDFDLFVNSTAVTSGIPLVFSSSTIPTAPLTVSETPVAGYTATFSGDCDASGMVTLSSGVDAQCIITNTFASTTGPSVDIDINGSDGPVTITDGDDWNYSWTSSGATACEITSPTGTSGVSLSGSGGPITPSHAWYPSVGSPTTLTLDCTDGTSSVSDSVTINVVSATTSDASLTVTKIVNGGSLGVGDFDLFVNSTAVTSGIPLVFSSSTIPTAPLTVSETPVAGYTATFSGDCDASGMVTLSSGVDAQCIITNTFASTTATTTSLTVTKVVNGGSRVVSDFPLFVNGMPITSGVATTTLAAGTYFISEQSNSNYSAAFSGDCAANGSVTIAVGVPANCVLTNTFTGTTTVVVPGNVNVPDVNVNVESGDVNAGDVNTGDVNVDLGGGAFPVAFPTTVAVPGQVLGARSVIPTYIVPSSGQVLGAQSYVPGLPSTGAEPLSEKLPEISLMVFAGFLALLGASLILAPNPRLQSSDKIGDEQ